MLKLSARVNSLLAVAVVSAVPVGLASCGFCGPSKCCGSKQEQVAHLVVELMRDLVVLVSNLVLL